MKTFSKLNLSLQVFPPREDGYHPIRSVFQAISIGDELTIDVRPGTGIFKLSCSADIPIDGNILTKIFARFSNRLPFELGATLKKNVPMGAGLGGGSANAAGFLAFLNVLGLGYSPTQLADIGLEFGADVPFFLTGGRALVEGIGERITPIAATSDSYLLINPNIHMDTSRVYKQFDLNKSRKESENMLKPIAFQIAPELATIEEQLLALNLGSVHMSGSGSTLFLIFKNRAEASRAKEIVVPLFPGYWIAVADEVEKGYQMERAS